MRSQAKCASGSRAICWEGSNARVSSSLRPAHMRTLGRRCRLVMRNVGLDQETSNRRSFGYWKCIRPSAARLANGSSIAFRLPWSLSGTAIFEKALIKIGQVFEPPIPLPPFPKPPPITLDDISRHVSAATKKPDPDADHRLGRSATRRPPPSPKV